MRARSNLINKKFGRLLAKKEAGLKDGSYMWECVCDCGNIKLVAGYLLTNGNTKSCGCLRKDTFHSVITKHGLANRSEYSIWLNIKQRCTNKNNPAYHNYGGRGIKMCEKWLQSFKSFLEDVGERPSLVHSLDRFPDNNGNYEPNNIRWATIKEQSRNMRCNSFFEINGLKMIHNDWAKYFKISESGLRAFLKSGKSFEQAYNYYTNKNITLQKKVHVDYILHK